MHILDYVILMIIYEVGAAINSILLKHRVVKEFVWKSELYVLGEIINYI